MEQNFNLRNFTTKIKSKKKKKINQYLKKIIHSNWPKFFESFKKNYKYSYNEKFIKKFKKFKIINIIGMGGSSLGSKAIYYFLKIG